MVGYNFGYNNRARDTYSSVEEHLVGRPMALDQSPAPKMNELPAHRDDAQVGILWLQWVRAGALEEAEVGVEGLHDLVDLLHGVH